MTERTRRTAVLARRLAAASAVAVLLLARAASAGQAVSFSGSAFADRWWLSDQTTSKRSPSGTTIDGAIKIGVDISENVTFSSKACVSCHGLEFESIQLEYMPKSWFNVAAGRFPVPFGEFSNRVDQSGHKTTSAPLIYDMGRMAYGEKTAMNLGVVPLPYVDTGVLVYGNRFLGPVQAWYGAYLVGGFRGGNDVDWTSMRSIYYTNSNKVPGGGGRLVLTYAAPAGGLIGDTSIGGSVTTGRYDQAGTLGYLAWGADATMQLWKLTLRGEYAWRRTDLSPQASYPYDSSDLWYKKDGYYVELEHPLGSYLGMVYRVDGLQRVGLPLPGADPELTTRSRITRYTAGVVITPETSFFVKLGYEYWRPSDFPSFNSIHFGVGGAF